MERNQNPHILLVGTVQPLWKTSSSSKNYTQNYYTTQQFHSCIHQEELRTDTQTDTCVPMFTAALFETVKRQRQPKCPSDKQINKRWHTHIMKEYSARGGMKFWQVPQHGQNLRTLNCVKYARYWDTYCMIPFMKQKETLTCSLYFWGLHCVACGILVPQPGIEPMPLWNGSAKS